MNEEKLSAELRRLEHESRRLAEQQAELLREQRMTNRLLRDVIALLFILQPQRYSALKSITVKPSG